MSQYHKIWIEVDTEKGEEKTKKLIEITQALQQLDCVVNVTKVQYQIPREDAKE